MKGDTGVIYPRRWKAIFSGVGGSGERRFCGDGRSLDPAGEVEKLPYHLANKQNATNRIKGEY